MAKKKLRGNAYLLGRMESENRSIYDELMAGRISSVRQAALLAGLKSPPSPLNGLKREWKKARAADHKEFLGWVRHGRGLPPSGRSRATAIPVTGPDGHLLPDVIDSIYRIMRTRKLKLGDAKVEMGLSRYDCRMSQALEKTARPKPEVLRALEPWLHKNKAHL